MATAVEQRMSVEEFERAYIGKRAELWRGEDASIRLQAHSTAK
ncbi:MAG: hypothetical protein NZ550_00965 [Fimbriimonadales bacterium]|nr:hypothetical protein [Fimbriimonadales bacterium]MDW8051385.1 hypothetical protein [Armatimonadota bacterium]